MTQLAAQVQFGYPFVASTVPDLEEMLDRLRGSAALRQAASRMLLDIAGYLSVRPFRIPREMEVFCCQNLTRFLLCLKT